jgi:hypothetical protein
VDSLIECVITLLKSLHFIILVTLSRDIVLLQSGFGLKTGSSGLSDRMRDYTS